MTKWNRGSLTHALVHRSSIVARRCRRFKILSCCSTKTKVLKGRVHHCTALWTLVCNGCMYSEELRLGRGHNQPLTLINKTDWQIHLMPQSSDRLILNYTSQKLLHMMSNVLLHPLSLIFHCRFQQHNLFNDKTPSSVSHNNVELKKQGHHGWMQCRPIGGSKWMVRRDSRWEVF